MGSLNPEMPGKGRVMQGGHEVALQILIGWYPHEAGCVMVQEEVWAQGKVMGPLVRWNLNGKFSNETGEFGVSHEAYLGHLLVCGNAFSDSQLSKLVKGEERVGLFFVGDLRAELGPARECISSAVLVARMVADLVIEMCQLFQPSELTAVQLSRLLEIIKDLVIGDDVDQLFG